MRLVFGFMTGTSLDALDGAAVRLSGSGLDLALADIAGTVTLDLPVDLRNRLRAIASGEPTPARDVARASRELGELHATAARQLKEHAGAPDLACAHGQTVFHAPPDSWQLFNPWPLALAANCPVVFDLRGADIASGGQGAPITPIADWTLFRHPTETRAVVNLGGFCNITILPANAAPDRVRGMDVCACNHLLNAAARMTIHQPFDPDGAFALRGEAQADLVESLRIALANQRASARSLGSGDELERALATIESRTPEYALASVVRAIAITIADALREHRPDRVLLAGGSTRNAALLQALQIELDPIHVETTEALSVPLAHREAVCFAVLGAMCADRTPITLSTITRCATPTPISGAWVNTQP